MVSIWVPSNWPADAAPWSIKVPFHDLMVVPGDVSDGPEKVVAELFRVCRLTGKPILFVPGNRDFSGSKLRTGEFNRLPNEIIVLEGGKSIVFKGVRFIGATLWTDFELTATEFASQKWAIAELPEYFTVRHSFEDRTIRPIDTANEHISDKAKLALALNIPHLGATVIVTHHAPSIRSLPQDVRKDVSSAAFASDLEDLITQHQPNLWIHSSIYQGADYQIGSTRVVSRARGSSSKIDLGRPHEELVITLSS